MTVNRKSFFDTLRRSLYKGGLPQSAVTALELTQLDEKEANARAEVGAYVLVTAAKRRRGAPCIDCGSADHGTGSWDCHVAMFEPEEVEP